MPPVPRVPPVPEWASRERPGPQALERLELPVPPDLEPPERLGPRALGRLEPPDPRARLE